MIISIQLLSAGINTGPFNLYSDTNNFLVPFIEGISRSELIAGYTTDSAPEGTTQVKVQSTGQCGNSIVITLGECITTTTSTTSTTTTAVPETTTTTTTAPIMPYGYCYYTAQSRNRADYACYEIPIHESDPTGILWSDEISATIGHVVYEDILFTTTFDGHYRWWKMEWGLIHGNSYVVQIDNDGVVLDVKRCKSETICPPD